ncbi:MAG: TolC family protein [Campylobacteraceae bacterium]|nr:TolC family protein [Campylobacteraceae bacterium]
MNKIVFCIYIIFFIITQSFSQTAYNFDILSNALLASPRLKQSEIETAIAEENINIANAGYYPSLKLVSNIERSKKFENLYTPSYVGDDSLTQSSGRYLSASLYLSYDIYRFGAAEYSVEAAKENMNALNAAKCLKEKESLISLLENYSKVRIQNYQLQEYEKMQKLYTELYALTKRLYNSGQIAKTNIMKYAKELADIVTMSAAVKEERAGYLSNIMYLSGISIQEDDTLESIDITDYNNVPFEKSVTAKKLMAVTAQKQAELNLQKTNYLPSVSFYARYDFYSSSAESYGRALNEFEKNGYRFGISFSMPLFDGFRNDADVNIKRLELMQSRLEYEDAKRAYEKEQFMIDSQIKLSKDRLDGIHQSVQSSKELVQAGASLYEAGESDKITLLSNTIDKIKIDISQNEASELLSMHIKKREIINKKETQCAAR